MAIIADLVAHLDAAGRTVVDPAATAAVRGDVIVGFGGFGRGRSQDGPLALVLAVLVGDYAEEPAAHDRMLQDASALLPLLWGFEGALLTEAREPRLTPLEGSDSQPRWTMRFKLEALTGSGRPVEEAP